MDIPKWNDFGFSLQSIFKSKDTTNYTLKDLATSIIFMTNVVLLYIKE